MSDAKRTRSVSFRLTDEEHTQLERAAIAAGEEVNNWCRQLAITAAREGPLIGKTGRLIYTELAILRFLIGHGFKLLFSRNTAEASAWSKLTMQADQKSDEIVQELLSRREVTRVPGFRATTASFRGHLAHALRRPEGK